MRPLTISFNEKVISCYNRKETEHIIRALYRDKEYSFKLTTPQPIILDVGAHIGLASLYFKDLYPDAEITCFEPNPLTFDLLQRNVANNGLTDITLINAAASNRDGETDFYVDGNPNTPWSWRDSIKHEHDSGAQRKKVIRVKTLLLSEYIRGNVDLVKIDIEGSESDVLGEIANKLNLIDNLAVEYHGYTNNAENDFLKICSTLASHNFSIRIKYRGFLVPPLFSDILHKLHELRGRKYVILFHAKQNARKRIMNR